ncbi:FAD/NAD(P)-binding protein [Methylobacterium frigidaeris]|uniref:Uncharacterized protein n=1 Tax=Methylobacterium frigidaeris TaxID=2038277 RepID=A0AA37M6U5_9HYPH|nr:FAD/NAD(P)-binding protein [Methylobacterium frigidaeris]GJD65288.1 hypothetical protein MPEAHAMD_5476 [Methylobacterium frigidaeris]
MPDTQHTGTSLRDTGPAPASRGRHVLVIGASASGLGLASHLLRREARVQVTVIEAQGPRCRRLRRGEFAALLAAETGSLPAEPLHLVEALQQHAGRLHVAETTCLSVAPTPQGVAARTADGTTYLGRAAVLAFALQPPAPGGAPREEAVSGRALRLDPADLPLGTGAAALVRALRALVREAEDRGVGTGEALAGLRLSAPALWHDLPDEARERLLRHGRRAWDRILGGGDAGPAPRRDAPRPSALLRDLVVRGLMLPRASGLAVAPGAADRVFAGHPADLMPYAAPRLLDLDAACAWLAGRVGEGVVAPVIASAEAQGPAREDAALRCGR